VVILSTWREPEARPPDHIAILATACQYLWLYPFYGVLVDDSHVLIVLVQGLPLATLILAAALRLTTLGDLSVRDTLLTGLLTGNYSHSQPVWPTDSGMPG
jgi:hypothetical protein